MFGIAGLVAPNHESMAGMSLSGLLTSDHVAWIAVALLLWLILHRIHALHELMFRFYVDYREVHHLDPDDEEQL